MDKKWIEVAGGGDSSEPTRTPDSLLSQDYFEVLLALSEGPIKGLVSTANNLENFFAGDTPAFNLATGQANFSDFSATLYTGTDQDSPIQMQLGGAAANVPINVSLASATPVVRQTPGIQRGLFDQIEVRLRFDYMAKTTNDGSFETTAQFRVEYKRASSGTWLHFENTNPVSVKGKTTTGYARDFIIPVPVVAEDYDIRVTKVSPDGVQGVDDEVVAMTWESYQLVKRGDVQYPGLALMHIYGKASNQFTSIPEFSGIYDGMIVRVPTNYNPETRVYDESVPWNGTFKNAHTSNGPWILYELLTNEKWGLSRYYKGITVNRYEFYEEAKWCDQMVPDGRGGTQPRFTYNDWVTEARSGPDLLKYIAGSFNAILDDDGNGYVTLRSDRPRPAAQVFTPDNVTPAGFNYTFTDVTLRHNDIRVAFINPDLDWEEDWRQATIDNTAAIAQNGRVPFDFVAVGCIDANEAVRRANYRYVTANEEVTTCAFTTARNGLLCNLLDTVYIADPSADWGNAARVKTAIATTIHLRDPMWFPNLLPRSVKVQTYSGLTELQVTPLMAGENYTLNVVGGNFPVSNVPPNTVFTVEDAAGIGLAKPFRVIGFGEVDGKPDEIEVTVHEIAVGKYEQIETGLGYVPSQFAFSTPGEATLPTSMSISSPQPTVNSDGTLTYALEVAWKRPIGAYTERYEIDFKRAGDTAWSTVTARGERATLTPVSDGKDYVVRLYAVSMLGHRSQRCLEQQATVLAKAGALENVLGLTVAATPNGWEARWSAPIDIPDFDGTDIRIGTTASTDFASVPARFTTTSLRQPIPWLPAGTHRVMAKFRSRSKNFSADAAIFDISVQIPATPILEVNRGLDNTLLRFQDCTTSQPLQDILVRMGLETSTWDTATATAGGGANQRSVTVIPSAVNITRVFVRARDVAGNLSNIAAETIPPATGDIQALLDLIQTGITEDSLSPSLLSTIELITAPSSTPGSVAAQVAAETQARVLALSNETINRNSAIADAEQRVTAQFGLADGVVLAAAKAYTYSKTEADQAISGQINTYNAALTGPAGPIQSAVNTEALARATADGHLGAQWTVKVGLANPGGPAEVAGIAVAGTSGPTQGARFDMAFRANAFYFLPPSGQDNTPYQPLVYYPTNQVIDGVSIPAGLYLKSAFVDYIKASQIDTRGITVKDASGNILFGSGQNLDWSRINAATGWLNSNITVTSSGTLAGIGSSNVVVDNTKVGGVNMVWGAANGVVSAGPNTYGNTVATLKDGAFNPHGLQPGELLTMSADIWLDGPALADGQTAQAFLYTRDTTATWQVSAVIVGSTTTPTRKSATLTLPPTLGQMHQVQVAVYHQPADGNYPGSVFVDRLQVQRGPTSTQYAPGAEPGATHGAPAGTSVGGVLAETLVTTANTASTNAASALSTIDSIFSDSKFTPVEKQQIKIEWDGIVAAKASINAQASALGITTENTNYNTTYDTLSSYITPLLSSLTSTSDIVGTTMRSTFAAFYASRQVLLNRMAAVAATQAAWSGISSRPADSELLNSNQQWSQVSGAGRPENDATVGAPAGTLVAGIPAADIATAVTNFNTANDRNGAPISAPSFFLDGSAVEHVLRTDGSADVGVKWQWAGDNGDIDGFQVYVHQTDTDTPYTFGSNVPAETVFEVPAAKRAFVLLGVAADVYYTFGVRAYRKVDKNVVPSGVVFSTIEKSTAPGENPYRPSASVAFAGNVTGNVTGNVAGVAASTLVADAQNAATDAQNAAIAAGEANTAITNIQSDSKLTPVEKQQVRKEWDAIYAERADIRAKADAMGGTSAQKTVYDDAFQALGTYMDASGFYPISATRPLWIRDATQLATTTDITGDTFRAAWASVYSARQALLNKIAEVAATKASWASVSSRPSNVAALTGSESIRNDLIGINASGELYGAGAGNGVVVSNNQLSLDAQGRLYSGGVLLPGQITYSGLGGGALGLINAIDAVNVDTYIQGAAIGLAKINTASITNLAALSATVGLLRTAVSGGRVEIADNVIRVYDGSNVLRVKIGNLSL